MDFKFLSFDKNNPIRLNIDITAKDKLYHYTNLSGVTGIVNSNSLWVSRSDYMNDKNEISYICKVIRGTWEELSNNKSYINQYDPDGFFYDNLLDYLHYLGENYRNESNMINRGAHIFILSLTENNDSLALFSGYSSVDGCNIEFDSKKLLPFKQNKNNIIHDDYIITAGKVIYSLDKQISIFMEDIVELYEIVISTIRESKIQSINQALYNKIFNDIMVNIIMKVHVYSLFFKHTAFYHEEEYRVAFIVDPSCKKIKYRLKDGIKVPFIEFSFKNKLPILSLKRGPKNKYDLRELLTKTKYGDIKVTDSDIPIR